MSRTSARGPLTALHVLTDEPVSTSDLYELVGYPALMRAGMIPYRSFRSALVQLLHEDRAALAQLLDDVLVVDDLLADVDRRAVELERALDGLDGPVDARAVAARRREQDLGGPREICPGRGRHAN